MGMDIHAGTDSVIIQLTGSVTARNAAEVAKELAVKLPSGAPVVIRAAELTDIDTCILQLLLAVRKAASACSFESASAVLVDAAERCALRRELLGTYREAL